MGWGSLLRRIRCPLQLAEVPCRDHQKEAQCTEGCDNCQPPNDSSLLHVVFDRRIQNARISLSDSNSDQDSGRGSKKVVHEPRCGWIVADGSPRRRLLPDRQHEPDQRAERRGNAVIVLLAPSESPVPRLHPTWQLAQPFGSAAGGTGSSTTLVMLEGPA